MTKRKRKVVIKLNEEKNNNRYLLLENRIINTDAAFFLQITRSALKIRRINYRLKIKIQKERKKGGEEGKRVGGSCEGNKYCF